MKINVTNIRPLYKTKKNPQVTDPQRIPKLMEPLERNMKQNFSIEMNKMLVDLTDKMIEFSKQNTR